MKKIVLCLGLNVLMLCVSGQTQAEFNYVLSQINADSLKKTVQDLQHFGNRYCNNTVDGNREVAKYLVNRLKNYGINNAKIDSFPVAMEHWLGGTIDRYMYNVVGRVFGESRLDSTLIIGAHFDAISTTENRELTAAAPGAEDNASGCAVMMEIARILHKYNLKTKYNIDFMAYDAEEIGLTGSFYDAEKRKNAEEKIVMMINNDMVSNQPDTLPWTLNFVWYDNSLHITDKAMQICEAYTVLIPHKPAENENNSTSRASDSYPYYHNGFYATFASAHTFSPYYHSVNDIADNCNFEYLKEVARMNFALLFNYAVADVFDLPTSTEDYIHSVSVFPNPTVNETKIKFYHGLQVYKIEIYDIMGRFLDSYSFPFVSNETIIDFRSFTNGVYPIRIYTQFGIVNKKIIKQ